MCSVRCWRCNARLEICDIGPHGSFLCVVTWWGYSPAVTHYILPQVLELNLLLNLEDLQGDPFDLVYDPPLCGRFDACRPEALWMTGEDDIGIRPGLHKCRLAETGWWLTGWAPSPADIPLSLHKGWDVDSVAWPQCASVDRVELTKTGLRHLEIAIQVLNRLGLESLQTTVAMLQEFKKGRAPIWVDAPLPSSTRLRAGEYYMLHHWLVEFDDREQRSGCAWPAWHVVRPEPDIDHIHHVAAWQVLRKDVCPLCGHLVAETSQAHSGCRGSWDKIGWREVNDETTE